MGSQRQDHFLNLKQKRDREVSVHTTHTGWSHFISRSHVSYREDTRNLQLEIDHLHGKLHRKQRTGSPTSSRSPSDDDDDSYRPRSRTPSNESFSYNEECHHR